MRDLGSWCGCEVFYPLWMFDREYGVVGGRGRNCGAERFADVGNALMSICVGMLVE